MAEALASGRRRAGGIRIRTTAAAVFIVGLVLIGASVTMVTFVARSVHAQVSDEAEIRARQIAGRTIAAGDTIVVGDPTEEWVQVLAGERVIASSENAAGLGPIAALGSGIGRDIASVPFAPGPFTTFAVSTGEGRTVVVGRSTDDVLEVRATVARALLVGVPGIMIVVAVVTWWIVGRALRPVEDIRAEVDRISVQDLGRRVPEPASGDEIARLAGTMNAMLARLESGQERQRRFISDASHELRSPVASLRQHAEVAAAHPSGTPVAELARVVLEEDARLELLVDDLLLLARLDEGAPGVRTEVDLDDVVLAEAARVRDDARVRVDTQAVAAARVLGNPAHLEKMVRNLTANAARHARSQLSLSLRRIQSEVVLQVEDDGPGIAEADRDRVFGRFVRLDGARSRGAGGTGLGLAIVREVVASHAGRVELSDSPLGGLRVEVRLPAHA